MYSQVFCGPCELVIIEGARIRQYARLIYLLVP